jgi:hypothetical protein
MNTRGLIITSLLLLSAAGAWLYARPLPSSTIPPRDEQAVGYTSHQPAPPFVPAPQVSTNPNQMIDWIKVDPNILKVGVRATVTVTAKIGADPALIPESINLFRYDERGQLVAALGKMYDDGTNGDVAVGDHIYTTQLTLNEPQPSTALLRASAAYRGLLRRVVSNDAPLYFQSSTTAEQTLSFLAGELEAGNIDAALKRFTRTQKNIDVLTNFTSQDRVVFASALRHAQFQEEKTNVRIYRIPFVEDDGSTTNPEITLAREETGGWIIVSW